MDPCLHLQPVQHQSGILHLPNGTGPIGPVILHAVVLHDPAEFQQDPAQLGGVLHADLAGIVGIGTQGDPVNDVVNFPDPSLFGDLINNELHLIAAYVNGAE